MTTTHDDKARELLPCPHCGKKDSVILTTTHDAWDDEEIYADSAVVVCDASSRRGIQERRGCGASGPCSETDEGAIAAWNRRAALSPASTGQEAELLAELDWCIENGNTGPRSHKALVAARSALAAPAQQVEAEIRDKALDEAIEAIDTGFDTIGDAASYDNRDLSPAEMEQLDAAIRCINIVRSLKSAAGSNNGESHE